MAAIPVPVVRLLPCCQEGSRKRSSPMHQRLSQIGLIVAIALAGCSRDRPMPAPAPAPAPAPTPPVAGGGQDAPLAGGGNPAPVTPNLPTPTPDIAVALPEQTKQERYEAAL